MSLFLNLCTAITLMSSKAAVFKIKFEHLNDKMFAFFKEIIVNPSETLNLPQWSFVILINIPIIVVSDVVH